MLSTKYQSNHFLCKSLPKSWALLVVILSEKISRDSLPTIKLRKESYLIFINVDNLICGIASVLFNKLVSKSHCLVVSVRNAGLNVRQE